MQNEPMNNKQNLILAATITVIVIAIGVFVFTNQNNQNSDSSLASIKKTEISLDSKSNDDTKENPANISNSNNVSDTPSNGTPGTLPVVNAGTTTTPPNTQTTENKKVTVESGYINYDASKVANAEFGKVILFFHASWCPSCKGLDTDIKNNVKNIPVDTLIMKVDFDSNPDLKSKYKVNSQHTLVQVSSNGDLIKSNPGLSQLPTLDSVIKAF